MSLNELKLIKEEEKKIVQDENDYHPKQLLSLRDYLEGKTKVQFQYRSKIVTIRGEPEDFKILLDDKLVCECIYDDIYIKNSELVKELLN